MGKIDFNFQSAYAAKDTVRIAAESMENEAKLIEGLITQTSEGWTGAGSEAYINYLQHILSEVKMSASRLYTLLEQIGGSINAAEEADRLSKEVIEAAVSTSGNTHGGGGRSFEIPSKADSHGGAGKSIDTAVNSSVKEVSSAVKEVSSAVNSVTNSLLGTFGKGNKKR